ncbi:MAG: Glutamine--scyllo-inositol transaminase [Myxococcaceae bacterium]|nr:Glutamine--scyllo-inositol transaminase [Myxococcaceae bacterium]
MFIGLSVPDMAPDVHGAVAEAIAQNWVAHVGPSVDAFERELAEQLDVPASFATHSGTAALHLALRVCGVEAGDVVFCSTLTFVASANPILYLGATPVFIDCEPESWGMSPAALEEALAAAKRAGKLPRAIIVVHLYGQCADMDALGALADAYGVALIEDAAEALGATYRGKPAGTLARVGVFSFAGNKIITTSAGGALVSSEPELVLRARFLGMQAREPAAHYEHSELGYNYRLSNVLAAIGRSQLRVLAERVAARRAVFAHYQRALAPCAEVSWMPECSAGRSNRWLSVLLLAPGALAPAALVGALGAAQIEARRVFKPLHLQPLYRKHPYYAHHGRSVSQELFARGVCVPSSSNLSHDDQLRVVSEIMRALAHDGRARPTLRNLATAS